MRSRQMQPALNPPTKKMHVQVTLLDRPLPPGAPPGEGRGEGLWHSGSEVNHRQASNTHPRGASVVTGARSIRDEDPRHRPLLQPVASIAQLRRETVTFTRAELLEMLLLTENENVSSPRKPVAGV